MPDFSSSDKPQGSAAPAHLRHRPSLRFSSHQVLSKTSHSRQRGQADSPEMITMDMFEMHDEP